MEKVGEVKNLEINIEEMKITYFIITQENKATKEILGKTTINKTKKAKIDTQSIEAIKDAVILRQPIDNLKGIIKRL